MDDMETPSNTPVTENSETAPDDTEVHLESIHSSMQSLKMEGSLHSIESGSMITITSTDKKTMQDEQNDQGDQKDKKDQQDQGDQKDQRDQQDHEDQGNNVEQKEQKEQEDQEPESKKRKAKRHEYIGAILASIICIIIPFIWYHLERESEKIILPSLPGSGQAEDKNDSCPFWHLLGDNYCDDEANIAECGYDFNDCCKTENDRSLCTACLCIIPEDRKIVLEDKFEKGCEIIADILPWSIYYGDGVCDVGFNTEEHFFDVGDCCLENPICQSSTFTSTAADPLCQENLCIESNIFCVEEELGDGICQGHNNGPYCDHDLGDCCQGFSDWGLATDTDSSQNCTCNCRCHLKNFYQIPYMLG